MKILFVINDVNVGGAQTLLEQLATVSYKYSWECHLLVLGGRGSLTGRLESAMKSVEYLGIERRSYRLDKLVLGVVKHIRNIEPDIVHSHLLQADLAAIGAGLFVKVPLVSTVHTTGLSARDPFRTRVLSRVLGLLARNRVTASVACGSGAAVYMRRMGYGSNFSIIANGVSVSSEFPRRAFRRTGQFLNLARFHPMKDHGTLLKAFAAHSTESLSSMLVLAGTNMDDSNEILNKAIATQGIQDRVELLGVVGDVSLPLSRSDALIISSSYGEALPMAGIEALSLGVPVIATDVGDCKSLTVDARLLVPPNDSEALSEAISHLHKMSDSEYAVLCQEAHKTALEKFSVTETASRYAFLYAGLADAKLQ